MGGMSFFALWGGVSGDAADIKVRGAILTLRYLVLEGGSSMTENMCQERNSYNRNRWNKNGKGGARIDPDTGAYSASQKSEDMDDKVINYLPRFKNARACTGGAVFVGPSASFTALNVTFRNNKAFNGGAIWGGRFKSIALDNCTFANNTSYENGGGISLEKISDESDGGFRVAATIFSSNSAMYDGGGMNLMASGDQGRGFQFQKAQNNDSYGSMDKANAINTFTNNLVVRGSGRQIQTGRLLLFFFCEVALSLFCFLYRYLVSIFNR